MNQDKKLKKEIGLFGVYAIATGTTLSAGFFLLPGIAAQQAGPAVVIVYLLAAIPLIPAMFSIIELATAMPRAGGVYYFLDRTLGPLWGTIGGIGTWLALILKVSFALVGMGAYLSLFIDNLPITEVAVGIAILLTFLNMFGSKKSGNFQIILVVGLLAILMLFVGKGSFNIDLQRFNGFWDAGLDSIFATTGLVYISYVGITKVASLSEEVKNPEKNLPLGVILSFITTIIFYGIGMAVMVGVLPMNQLAGSLTPVANAAKVFLGDFGLYIVTVAALIAFTSVANAGLLSSSRYPWAMSRDKLVPNIYQKLSKSGTPIYSLLVTVFVLLLILIFLEPAGIAKLASAFQLLMFALVCLAVVVMRESKIDSYDPGYKSPFYPWMQIIGIISPFFLIVKMGSLSIIFSSVLVVLSALWFMFYGSKRVNRTGAIFHVFERLGKKRYGPLEIELRGIMKEKGLRKEDPFDEIVARSNVLDLNEHKEFEEIVDVVSSWLSEKIFHSAEEIRNQFLEGTRIGATPVTHGVALPHMRTDGLVQPEMVLVRAKKGVHINFVNPLTGNEENQNVKAVFFLMSPEQNPSQHLRLLAQIAGRIDEESFMKDWESAVNEDEIREALLHDEKWVFLVVNKNNPTSELIEKQLKDIQMPKNSLIAVVRRTDGSTVFPQGDTLIKEGDKLTIIGDPLAIKQLEAKYLHLTFGKTLK